MIGVSAAPTFALPPVPFCQTPTEQQQAQDANARPNKLEKPSRSDDTHLRLTQTDSRVKIEIWKAGKAAEECLEKRLKRAQNPTIGACNAMQCNAMQARRETIEGSWCSLVSSFSPAEMHDIPAEHCAQLPHRPIPESPYSLLAPFFVLSTSSLLPSLSVPWTKY